ncbi:TlpA family protein disulfide reductase [Sporichthya polymorpha]|uniref:TlpA family protein disulfide reductase n=1 Tax=Sporichthya polymorpha TaxID=35751 RepID=UPI0003A3E4CD|nr:TlpA disulfide reductase family protein [Sporichthya polymorpha]
MRAGRLLAAVAATLVALTACGAEDGPATPGGDRGFVSGTGAVTIIAPQDRGEPIALAGEKVGGGTLDLAALRGKIVLLNVWGSWCAPCRKEAPYLQAAWDQTRKLGDVQFVGLNTRDDAVGAAEAFERRFGITYPSLRDNDGRLQLVFRATLPPRAIPSTIVLDRQGRVAARIIGEGSRATFVGLVDQIRSEA